MEDLDAQCRCQSLLAVPSEASQAANVRMGRRRFPPSERM